MSKIEQLYAEWQNLQPLKEADQERLRRKFLLEFNYNSNHIEGNTLTYGQTEILLLFGRVIDSARMKDLEDMKASNVGLNMMQEQAVSEYPLTETFIRQLHKTIMREDYVEYRSSPDGKTWHYTVHAGIYKTRPNSVITPTGERFEYASPEETPALMTDLVNWYREEEERGVMTPIELASLFHFRYIRIHPFEDGNGRIARLMVNYILLRHHYPMIVVKASDKDAYLDALNKCDEMTGPLPIDGANASLGSITPFVEYLTRCLERALQTCISAAKGEMIEEDDDFVKQVKIVQRNKRQLQTESDALQQKNIRVVRDVLDFVFFPLAEQMFASINGADSVFHFRLKEQTCLLSRTKEVGDGVRFALDDADIERAEFSKHLQDIQSAWVKCKLAEPLHPQNASFSMEKTFYIAFFDDHYFVDGILNKDFPYGKYPTEAEKQDVISQFKENILKELQDKL